MNRTFYAVLAALMIAPVAQAQGVISPIVHPPAREISSVLQRQAAPAPHQARIISLREAVVPAAMGQPGAPGAEWNPFEPSPEPGSDGATSAPKPPPPPPAESAFDQAAHTQEQLILQKGTEIGVLNGKAIYAYKGHYALEDIRSVKATPVTHQIRPRSGQCVIEVLTPLPQPSAAFLEAKPADRGSNPSSPFSKPAASEVPRS